MTEYRCILADPPWSFRDKGSRISPDYEGRHYDTLELDEIIALGINVRRWAAARSHLWLWAPNAFVVSGDAQLVARLWGFRARQLATWCKPQMGMGHWLRNASEQLLFCTRGSLAAESRNVRSWFVADRQAHSTKPAEAYDVIEAISPGPRLEMFARTAREGWDSWGSEAPSETAIGVR